MRRVVLLGAPGSGKGTQGERLSKQWNVPHIASGEILRRIIATEKSPLAEAARVIHEGKMVADETINAIIFREIDKAEAQAGFLLDGYPRTVAQAEALDLHLAPTHQPLSCVIALQVDESEILQRIAGRLKGEVREDDKPENVRTRFKIYHEKTEPLIAFYRERDLLRQIDGTGSMDDVFKRILHATGTSV